MGGKGQSLLMLSPHEREYVDLLSDRSLQMQEIACAESAANLLASVRACVQADRDLYERSQRAYVSLVRAYREHLCDFIFKLESYDYAGLACALGLLQLPFMKELVRAGAKANKGVPSPPTTTTTTHTTRRNAYAYDNTHTHTPHTHTPHTHTHTHTLTHTHTHTHKAC
jgi:hypothetical protein